MQNWRYSLSQANTAAFVKEGSCSIEVSWGAEVSINLLLNRICVVFRSAGDPLHFSWPPANLRLLYYFSLLQNSCRIPIPRQVSVACYTWETGLLVQLDSISEFWSEILSLSPRFLKVNTKYFLLSLILGYFVRLVGGGRIPATSDGGHRGLETVFFCYWLI